MKKVMILYSTGGMGHKKAAMALKERFEERSGDVEVKNIDTLDYGNAFYKFLYVNAYVFLMTKAKTLWGLLYYFSDLPFVDWIMKKIRPSLDLSSLKGLDEMIAGEKPDAIVTTHFVLPAISKYIRKMKDMNPRMYVVVTDYGPHAFWFARDIDRYFVGAEDMVYSLMERGILKEKITVSGIPVVKDFDSVTDIDTIKEEYDLDRDLKTIFMLSGGFGVGPMGAILNALNECKAKIQVMAVCGHNEKMYEDLKKNKKQT